MEIQQNFDGAKGSFFIEQDGTRVAEMTYVQSTSILMIIDHTEVSPILKGQGVGAKLVRAGVEHARQNGLKIVPLCPFAKVEFERHTEYADVLVK
ncbi:MAG: N-acetyltransferase [bacterium]|nr:N-acetyltransferase [bacterium]